MALISCQADVSSAIEGLTEFVNSLPRKGQAAWVDVAEKVQSIMQEEGSPITYPVNWDSDKQRRWYFAYRRENNLPIPYERTGAYVSSWAVTVEEDMVILHNNHPAGAIGGTLAGWQSQIHQGRWNNIIFDALNQVYPDVEGIVASHMAD